MAKNLTRKVRAKLVRLAARLPYGESVVEVEPSDVYVALELDQAVPVNEDGTITLKLEHVSPLLEQLKDTLEEATESLASASLDAPSASGARRTK